jgi:hypothetical protein
LVFAQDHQKIETLFFQIGIDKNPKRKLNQSTKMSCVPTRFSARIAARSNKVSSQPIKSPTRFSSRIAARSNVRSQPIKSKVSPFIAFCHANRDAVKAANPTADFGETGKILADMWKETKRSEEPPQPKTKAPVFLYIAFCNSRRAEIAAANPTATYAEIATVLTVMWKSLSESEKAAYA